MFLPTKIELSTVNVTLKHFCSWNLPRLHGIRDIAIALKLFLSHHRLVSNESWIYCKDLQESPWSYHNHIMTISWPYHGDIMMFHFISGMLVGRRRNMYPNKHKKTAMREHIYWPQACLNTLASGLHCSQGLPLDIFRSIRTVADYLHGLCAVCSILVLTQHLE